MDCPAHALEVGCYVVLSTLHIRCSNGNLFDKWYMLPANAQPLPVSRTNYGWFIPSRFVLERTSSALPSELDALLGFARSEGCAHILLDSDGPIEPGLPILPW